ncbi:MAG: YwhD family protein [Kyrpidia tusciae]|nr:YwhD family protein [Kyrpidia tusciae]MBE3552276.1 YwhD family protein [Kyrpidia tusciae]
MEELELTGQTRHKTPDELSGLTAVILDGENVYVDKGALHAKSRVERGISFSDDPARLGQGRRVAVVWVSLGRNEQHQPCVHGLGACEMWVNEGDQTGYKRLAEHVNQMDQAVKGRVSVDVLGSEERRRLADFFAENHRDVWEASSASLRDALLR